MFVALTTTAAFALSRVSGDAHPVLPSMWTATVKEEEIGVFYESENFVYHPNDPSNPDAKWTNYTDGSCQRLILEINNDNKNRYLLGCEAVNCCVEEIAYHAAEYQIPNVRPSYLAPVKHAGQETFERFDGVTVTADVYEWNITLYYPVIPKLKYRAFVTADGNDTVATLHKWELHTQGQIATNQYANYTAIALADAAAFRAQFQKPDICQDAMKCNDAFAKGLISEKSLKFLRSGKTRAQRLRENEN